MPYKDPEDRAESQKRYRERLKEAKEHLKVIKEDYRELVDNLECFLLDNLGWKVQRLREWVLFCQGLSIKKDAIVYKNTGAYFADCEGSVLFHESEEAGLDKMIVCKKDE